ncbi:hypothetical protein SISNIDRAFT_486866 [Sistotremastrum niveocremeum HHB9708]|uniref:Uncharacterized protein n=1 Tax=Sistotremastrum niveocremeum HHB9708 TaxID=1314777 RepID=A0A164SYN6_9AGAM|nr:hypothetical protein SISNIDRAFT_486866 [Sistotremastrum niveocremeum HHB9708]
MSTNITGNRKRALTLPSILRKTVNIFRRGSVTNSSVSGDNHPETQSISQWACDVAESERRMDLKEFLSDPVDRLSLAQPSVEPEEENDKIALSSLDAPVQAVNNTAAIFNHIAVSSSLTPASTIMLDRPQTAISGPSDFQGPSINHSMTEYKHSTQTHQVADILSVDEPPTSENDGDNSDTEHLLSGPESTHIVKSNQRSPRLRKIASTLSLGVLRKQK